MSEEYSQKEEDTFRKELFRRMDNQDTDLREIKTQTTRTNGRVSKLEWWRSAIIWSCGIIVALAIPILQFIQTEIHSTVVGILADQNITVQK